MKHVDIALYFKNIFDEYKMYLFFGTELFFQNVITFNEHIIYLIFLISEFYKTMHLRKN